MIRQKDSRLDRGHYKLVRNYRSSEYTLDFLSGVLQKYSQTTLHDYCGLKNLYSRSSITAWRKNGVPNTIIELIQQEVQLAFLLGRVPACDLKNLDDLWSEYLNSQKSINE
jgi:hypothetical protein